MAFRAVQHLILGSLLDVVSPTWVDRVPALLVFGIIAAISLALPIWWIAQQRISGQRSLNKAIFQLGEEILRSSPSDIVRRLSEVIPKATGASAVALYVFNRRSRMLDRVGVPEEPPLAIDSGSTADPLTAPIAAAFRDRNAVCISDTKRDPAFKNAAGELPRAILYLPMFVQTDPVGVLVIEYADARGFRFEDRALLQHLANQIAIAITIEEQRAVREHTFRSERLNAAGQLVAALAGNLKGPLGGIASVSKRLQASVSDAAIVPELRKLASEISRASEILTRLMSFDQPEDKVEQGPVEINGMLSSLMHFRQREWEADGMEVQCRLSPGPLYLSAAEPQLEQLMLNVLLFAEQAAAETSSKTLFVGTNAVGRNARIEIKYSVSEGVPVSQSEDGGGTPCPAGLSAWRSVVKEQGGEWTSSRATPGTCRLDIELPLAGYVRSAPVIPDTRESRTRTTLVVEPDVTLQRRIVRDLSARGHRAIPVCSAEEGIDLVQRLRFDIVFCSAQLPGIPWTEFFGHARESAGALVLIVDGFGVSPTTVSALGGLLLNRSSYEAEIGRVLREAESVRELVSASPKT